MFGLLWFFVAIALATPSLSERYTISTNSSLCQKSTACFSLNQLARSNLLTNGENLTLAFQPGEHILMQPLSIYNFSHVQIMSKGSTSFIKFHEESWIELSSINQLSIEGLTFTEGVKQDFNMPSQLLEISYIQNLTFSNCSFTGLGANVRSNNGESHEYGDIVNIKNIENALIESIVSESNNGTALNIIDSGTVSIENCLFADNQGLLGGAVSVYSSHMTINNSIFISNIAGHGGAIAVVTGQVFVANSVMTNNSAAGKGGGIVVTYDSASVSISQSHLIDNSAEHGGGIAVVSGSAIVSSSSFNGNMALDLGGGIAVAFGNLSLSHSVVRANSAYTSGGGIAIVQDSASASISNSHLIENSAKDSGGIVVYAGSVTLTNSSLVGNVAFGLGGGITLVSGNLSVFHSVLRGNSADTPGGGIAILLDTAIASISNSHLTYNSAKHGGGIAVISGSATISDSRLIGNIASGLGGGIAVNSGSVSMSHSTLIQNSAKEGGGILIQTNRASLHITHSTLEGNSAHGIYGDHYDADGGGICVILGTAYVSDCVFTGNSANEQGGGMTVGGNASIINTIFSGNTANNSGGGITIINSAATTISHSAFTENKAKIRGGAIFVDTSQLYCDNGITIDNNTVEGLGGEIFLSDSSLVISFSIRISRNRANSDGGAIYAYHSTVEFKQTGYQNIIARNIANNNGGGIYAIVSTLKVDDTFVTLDSNRARKNGGAFYLLDKSRLYIQKREKEESLSDIRVNLTISNNIAQYGAGIYVDDSTAGGSMCRNGVNDSKSISGICFMQTLSLYGSGHCTDPCNTVNTFIHNNTALQRGNAIYGGLLDRCTVSASAEFASYVRRLGLDYINKSFELQSEDKHSISSDPVRVELCHDSSQLNVFAKKGHPFRLHVKAVDQAGNPVNAIIHGSVITKSGIGRLKEGQVEQRISSECTELEYNVFSQDDSAQVELYAIGPCSNIGISNLTIKVSFLDCICSLGLHQSPSLIECSCECDLELHVSECFPNGETFQLDTGKWIETTNFTTEQNETGYFIHDCPFDYCVDQPVNISLNSSQEIDRQCAYNRSGVLCGECDEGLSLVFASSRCAECSSIYLLLLIPFAVAGIALVVFILLLNTTIATGTIYGLIFYANILAANRAIFLPFTTPNFLTVFVSWANLDFGIETCFYNGMTSQAKVLLQLAFPTYLFFLILLIIILSKYINLFAKLLSNRNPVAALCTLFILSYSKLLRLIISALQFTFLDYPDGSHEIVWLYDSNIQYFSPSYIPRFIAAAIILTACVLFTTLLFFGQWLPRCSNWRIMKWTKNTKYVGFMDAFHAPFTPKHRYWPGLLLFALIVHNLIASMAQDKSIPVLSAGCIPLGLIVYKSLMNRVYKSRLNDTFETLFLLNMGALAYGTFTIKHNSGQQVLANVSMAIAFIQFVMITCYHFYKYVLKKTNVWNNNVPNVNRRRVQFNFLKNRNYQELVEEDENVNVELPPVVERYSNGYGPREETDPDKYITPPIIRPATRPDQLREPALDILAPVTEEDYRRDLPMPQAGNNRRPVVTRTVVELN